MEEILSYIEDLKLNNNREWFHANKSRYEKARKAFMSMVQDIIDKLQFADPKLAGLEAKDTIFRIYRDIRFSNDKTPYKTHFSAYMASGGRKSQDPGYYVHLSKEEMFIGAGVYQPEKEDLKAIRQEILYQLEKFKSLTGDLKRKGYDLLEEDKLKTGPKDFPKNSPGIEYLKYRHYILMKTLSPDEGLNGAYTDLVVKHFTEMVPFNNFLYTAIEYKGN